MADQKDSVELRIRRGRVDSVSLYEVTEHELELLAEGSAGSTYLNFAIFFLSTAVSFLGAVLMTPPASDRVFIVIVVIVVVGFSVGGVLLVLWNRVRKQTVKVLQKVKDRCVSESPNTTPSAAESVPASTSDATKTEADLRQGGAR